LTFGPREAILAQGAETTLGVVSARACEGRERAGGGSDRDGEPALAPYCITLEGEEVIQLG